MRYWQPTSLAVLLMALAVAAPAHAFTYSTQSPTDSNGNALTDPDEQFENNSNGGITTPLGGWHFGATTQPNGETPMPGRPFSSPNTVGQPPSSFLNLFPNSH